MKKLTVLMIAISSLIGADKMNAQVGVGVSISVAPPELPDYAQPPCPTDGYMWSPGYWAYGPDGYYWVPGVWVAAPQVGFLWTPGYWGYGDGGYFWNGGYWGESVGFYGGVCYGYGYGGHGFYGGRWDGGHFQYNTAAWHVGGGIHNTYNDKSVIHNSNSHTSFNGRGGITDQPNTAEQASAKQSHTPATSAQQSHQQKAGTNKNQLAKSNGGHPTTTAKSTVGGERFNSGGKSISTIHSASHSKAGNNMSRPAASRPANVSHASAPQQQARPAQQQQRPMQTRPAPQQQRAAPQQQHQNAGMQRQAAPQQGRGGQGGGGAHPSGGGGGGHSSGGKH